MREQHKYKGPGIRGPVSKTPAVVWKEVSGKKITSPGGLSVFSVILVLGETTNSNQPIFCLTLKEKQPKAKWYSHSITLNKAECEWLISNVEQLTSGQHLKHSTENHKGETVRTLSAILRKGKGVPTISFKQVKNGKVDKLVFPRAKVDTLIRYFTEAIDDYNGYTDDTDDAEPEDEEVSTDDDSSS